MKYKGFLGTCELDEDAKILFGRVIGIRDVITFQGESVAGFLKAFRDSVDDYLQLCKQRGESPEKPLSGKILLRIDPRLHGEWTKAAQQRHMSLNALIEQFLEAAIRSTVSPQHELLEQLTDDDRDVAAASARASARAKPTRKPSKKTAKK